MSSESSAPAAPSALAAAPTTTPTATPPVTTTPSASATPEVKAPVTTPEKTSAAEDIKRFTALSRKEKEMRLKFETREKELAAKEAGFKSWESAQKSAKEDPMAFLEKSGLTLQEVVDKFLNPVQVDPKLKAVEDKLKELTDAQKKEKTELTQKQQKEQQDQVFTAYSAKLQETINTSNESKTKYELVSQQFERTNQLALDMTEQYFEKYGTILTPDQVLEAIEAQYETEAEEAYSMLSKSPKLQSKYKLTAAQAAEQAQDVIETRKGTKVTTVPSRATGTLSNDMESSSSPDVVSTKGLTKDQRRELALKQMKWIK